MLTTPQADKIIEFTLRHVPFDGWTTNALKRGAIDAGSTEEEAIKLFGDNPLTMIEYYSHMLDRQMTESISKMDLSSMKIREKIATCVFTRLQLMGPYRESAQKAAVLLSLPLNAPLGTRLMYKTVDEIWILCGDNATDFNFYTKRALLSMVYSSTLLYWFRDMSVDFANTREFLNRRIENVMSIPKIKSQVRSAADFVSAPLRKFFKRDK
jgi:ubiquinone biosynthesis protein COQ9